MDELPTNKYSYIFRSFGYIFGSPDCGHRFFGIKTDKAASQVVLAMRDLFQCVFELKKKEIELAKQHIQNRITAHEHQQVKNSILDYKKTPSSLTNEASKTIPKAEKSPEATANLVDLEQELSSIQRGITQMERITPNDDAPTINKNVLEDDPFGDSFTSFSSTPFNILPPPASSKRNQLKQNDDTMSELSSIITKSSTPPIPPYPSSAQQSSNNDSWLNSATTSSVFDEPEPTSSNFNDDPSRPNRSSFDDSNNANLTVTKSEIIGAFTDLDPLGTGRSKPYVDKKYFFQDLKNPPKRVLKDLSEQESIFDAHFSPMRRPVQGGLSLDSNVTTSGGGVFDSLKTIDPFEEEDFSKINIDQFETTKSVSPKSIILPDTKISTFSEGKQKHEENKINDQESYNAPLHVDLPPESWNSSAFSDPKRLERQGSDSSTRNVFSVDAFSKKLPKTNLFGQRSMKRDSNGINMRRLQESDSLSENEPELPPRPDTGSHEPPPLPPKNHRDNYNDQDSRNRYSRTQIPSRDSGSRYDYSSRFKTQSSDSPPLPLPSRKVNRSDSSYSSTSRPLKKSNEDDDYLAPNPNQADIPTLLPPPQKKDPSKLRGSRRSETDPKNLDAATPPVSAKPYEIPTTIAPILPDITLSQLLTLGIDDLAHKLNVPTSKLNTMTIVELTKYLSEFIEKAKYQNAPPPPPVETPPNESPVFKVSFDDSSDATFIAKFDDNFGEPEPDDNSFVANFENFNQPPVSVIPTADRYAVFREIIDQEIQSNQYETPHQESIESNNSNSLEEVAESSFEFPREIDSSFSPGLDNFKQSPITTQMTKIDTKITDAISGAKDRYAALRDIILVEDLFDKSAMPPLASISDSNLSDDPDDVEQVFDTAEVADNNSVDNVPTYSISWADAEANPSEISEPQEQQDDQKSLQIISTSNKDDFEIDDYMKKAISELSLDQRLSPNIQNKSPSFATSIEQTISKQPSPTLSQLNKPPSNAIDVSTSPMPIKSPLPLERRGKSPFDSENVKAEFSEESSVITATTERSEDIRGKFIALLFDETVNFFF